MTEIKRYEEKGCDASALYISEDGPWVDYYEHAAIVAELQEQVRALAAENLALKSSINKAISVINSSVFDYWEDRGKCLDPLFDIEIPATNTVLREIRAQAVESYANYSDECYGTHDKSGEDARVYAARIRSGE